MSLPEWLRQLAHRWSLPASRRSVPLTRRWRKYTPLFLERLENRVTPTGNITLTNVSVVDGNDNPLSTVHAGQLVYIQANFTTQNLPSNASYSVAYNVNGLTLRTGALNYGAGLPGTNFWYEYWGFFIPTPGTNQVTVAVDPNKSVPETTYTDNTSTTTFNAVTPAVGNPSYTVAQIRSAYGINSIPNFGSAAADGSGQTIAIIDAYNDPTMLSDVDGFDQIMSLTFNSPQNLYQQYGAASSFLSVYNQNGVNITSNIANSGKNGVPNVDPTGGWEGEETMDVEWAHAIAPGAKIDLIETDGQGNFGDLFTGAATAAHLPGVTAMSMSWIWFEGDWSNSGGSGELALDSIFETQAGHPGITFLASSGDGGQPGGYPAYSPNVVAVGGTQLAMNNNAYDSETAWSFPTPRTLNNGSSSYSQSGSWTSQSGGFSGTYSTAAGGSNSSAVWATSISSSDQGWVGGTEVSATWTANPGNATNATYLIYDGSGTTGPLIGAVTVDQTKAPVGILDGNTQFQELGDFYPQSGNLTVVLEANSANGTVVADAVGIAPAWATGGGQSQYEPEPSYQLPFQSTGQRTIPDVSFDGSINSGVTCFQNGGLGFGYAGTSLSSPCWAGLIAIANQGRVANGGTSFNSPTDPTQTLQALYNLPESDFHDIPSGYNGFTAVSGYNELTGRGSPIANLLIPDLVDSGNAPTVTSIGPSNGSVGGGTSVTITGTGFTDGSTVKFGKVAATSVTVNSSTSITAVAPPESAGSVDVTVTTPYGTSATSSADQFTYEHPVDTWTGGAGTLNWTDGGNWSLGAAPTSADDVVIGKAVIGPITVNITNPSNQSIHSLTDSSASLYVTGGSLSIAADSSVSQNLTIAGGSVTASGQLNVGSFTQSGGTFTGSGTLTVTGQTVWTGGTMSGSGTTEAKGGLQLGANDGNTYYETLDTRTLQNDGSATLQDGGGYFYQENGSTFDNESGATLDILDDSNWYSDGSAASFNNQGSVEKTAGTGTTSIQTAFSNPGTLDVESGTLDLSGGFTNFSSNTLSGGTYVVKATLQFYNAAIQTNQATIVLNGSASQIIDQSSNDALANFSTNASTGSFTIENGRDITLTNSFDNSGTTIIGTGSTFTATSYTQSDGTTQLAGGTLAASGGVSLMGGTLDGNGTVAGNVSNGGTVAPGSSTAPGQITINGTYTQTSGGTLEEKIAGKTTAGTDYDQLAVSGAASLDGTIDVSILGTYTPLPGDQYQIVTFASASGDFATKNGYSLSSNTFLTELFNASNLTLKVMGIPTVTVTDNGGVYNGSPFGATNATVTGIGSDGTLASFGDSTLSYTYYVGTGTGGTNLGSSAPVNAGTYTVVATYTSNNTNYTNADSTAVTFTITPAPLTVTAVALNKPSDGTTTAYVILSDNHLGNDQIADSYTSASFADANQGNNKTVTVSGISISGTSVVNYTLQNTTAATTANITKAGANAYTYDSKGRLIGTVYTTGNVYERIYASDGSSTATLKDSSGNLLDDYTYNSAGQLTAYDAYYSNGNVFHRVYASDGSSTATLKDSSGNLLADYTYNAAGTFTAYDVYYSNGNVYARTYAPDDSSTATLKDSSGNLLDDYTYNAAGSLTLYHLYYSNGNVYTRTYAPDGSSTATIKTSSGTLLDDYTYNAAGALSAYDVYSANGNVFHRVYASDGSSTATLTNSSGTLLQTNNYNAQGQLTSIDYATDKVLTFTYTSGVLSSATLTTNGGTLLQTDNYNATGQLISIIIFASNGNTLTYTYTSGVLSMATLKDSGNNLLQTYNYNAQGKLSSIDYATNGNTLTYTYMSGVLTTASLTNSSNTVLQTYNYNASGQVSSIDDGSGTPLYTYTYDSLGRVSTVTYASNGNVLTFTYNSDGTSSATLDTSGGTPIAAYKYDVFGRVTEIDYANGNTYTRTYAANGTSTATLTNKSGQTIETYTYDAQGNLTGHNP